MRILQIIIIILLVTGCGVSRMEYRESVVNDSFLDKSESWKTNRKIGLALAGGGTKASSFSMGVVKALTEEDFLWEVDAVSSVSGGSYTAYYLFSRLVHDIEKGRYSTALMKTYFTDCFPDFYFDENSPFKVDTLNQLVKNKCNLDSNVKSLLKIYRENYIHQQFVRCSQDVLKGDCDVNELREDDPVFWQATSIVGAQLMSFYPGLLANTVFDWPLNNSPSREMYRTGIANTYGLYPVSIDAVSGSKLRACERGAFENCVIDGSNVLLDDNGNISFSRLEETYQTLFNKNEKFPLWMINATAAPSRSILGWWDANETNFEQYSFLMTPFKQGSNYHGEIGLEENGVSVLDGVVSSAAFFDSNQTVTPQPYKFGIGVGLHLFNMNWGLDVPHPGASEFRRNARALMPFPFYYADYLFAREPAYVRLIDGGSTDNLGAYALAKNGFKNIIISDHAYDDDGKFEDVCTLRNEMIIRHERYLQLPGLKGFAELCNNYINRSEGDSDSIIGDGESIVEHKYDMKGWNYPFLAGCLTDEREDRMCASKSVQRIWLLKPAYDLEKIKELLEVDGSQVQKVKACDTGSKIRGESINYPCELMGYFAQKITKDGKPPKFPQNTTVGMTLNSGPRLYGAYRELADYYTTFLIDVLKGPENLFFKVIDYQSQNPIVPIGSKKLDQKKKLKFRSDDFNGFYEVLYSSEL